MTPAEVRAIVERVVAEHGQGWGTLWTSMRRADRCAGWVLAGCCDVEVRLSGDVISVTPAIYRSHGDVECARAVALWPEMQRLCAMLREALHGPNAGTP